ncbi:MAG: EAL domain-containing protein [Pseudomonadota bacterium]|nr:EAL domain-containing protein [Pseudomonadota bacterium]
MKSLIVRILGLNVSELVARAQVDALRSRVPYLYAMMIIDIAALCYTHRPTHPLWQIGLLPFLFCCCLIIRIVRWLKLKPERLDLAEINRIRTKAIMLGGVIGCSVLVWALSLHAGDVPGLDTAGTTASSHIDFFVGITVMSCIFMLMHLRGAAIVVATVVVFPFTVFMLATGRQVEIAIAINLVLVAAAMLYVAVSFARDFDQMVLTAADLERLSAQNALLAVSDVMTGLPNRRRFFQELERLGAENVPFAILVVDLDGFKPINDIYGHNAGDEVLIAVAERLRTLTLGTGLLARLGGDEFACLLHGADLESAEALGARLVAACSMPIICRSLTANIGASAGLCCSRSVSGGPSRVYERADYALFEAKRAGRGRVERFNGSHEASMMRASRIGFLLRSGNLCQELVTHYQPVLAANSRQITSFEALVRWISPELGLVGPGEFIPIAERTDRIFEITRYVLRAALGHAADWPRCVSIKVNLSVRDLMSATQTQALLQELSRSDVSPNRVTFEITETIFAESLVQVCANLDLLRAAGCAIAVDDFGVGFSSLNYIHTLSPDIIKVDRCFVDAVESSEQTRRIIRTIVELARNVGARSIAEGVETAEQARLLEELGCDELQGFYFSRPLPPDAAAELAGRSALSELMQVGRVAAVQGA